MDEFAIGFGKELIGFNDKRGTRWKFCLFPIGGYVKMHGDRNAASVPDVELVQNMSPEERKKSFLGKNVYQRMAIVAAGPVANFLLAIVIFTFLFRLNGLTTIAPVVDEVLPESAAFESGLQKGDEILWVDDVEIVTFDDMRQIVTIAADRKLSFKIKRAGKVIDLDLTPKTRTTKDFFGDDVKIGMIGVSASEVTHEELNLGQSFIQANVETYNTSIAIFKAVGELITGRRSIEELGGPIKIAKYSGKTMEMGFVAVVWFMAMISVNLGVMNLLPVPILDGGHLFYYIIEAIFRKPLSQKIQQIGFRVGFSLVMTLMLLTTFNDVRQLFLN